MTHFFETYKIIVGKEAKINKIEDVEAAKEAFTKSLETYKQKFNK